MILLFLKVTRNREHLALTMAVSIFHSHKHTEFKGLIPRLFRWQFQSCNTLLFQLKSSLCKHSVPGHIFPDVMNGMSLLLALNSCVICHKMASFTNLEVAIFHSKKYKCNYVRKVGILGVQKGMSALGIIPRAISQTLKSLQPL